MDLIILAQAGTAALPTDAAVGHDNFSLWSLFWQAHIVVQIVMIGLVVSSIWTWAIILEKVVVLANLRRKTNQFEEDFWSGRSLEDLCASMARKRRCRPPHFSWLQCGSGKGRRIR